jgi:polyphosphate kinase
MSKKGKKEKKDKKEPRARSTRQSSRPAKTVPSRNERYERELARLQVELSHLQSWVKETGARIVVVFEGRDAAGKGGVIKRITERVSPRVFRVVALPAPTEREKTQVYIQRYIGTCRRPARS